MRSRVAALIIVAIAGLTAACSNEPGQASPATSTAGNGGSSQSSSGPQPLPHSGAPEVTDPLPVSLDQHDPCTVLTPAQIDELFSKQPEGEPHDSGVAHVCYWGDPVRASSVAVQLFYGVSYQDGLSGFYERTKPHAAFWEELAPVQGYPVVAYGGTDDRETRGNCSLLVGVADDVVFQVDGTLPKDRRDTGEPCKAARQVADMAITTLKKGVN